jgi:translation initiation factor IF-2
VDIVSSPIIYRLMESVKEKVIALLPPTIEKKVTGEATVMELFSITVKGEKKPKIVAGSRSRNGTILKKQDIRVVRNGQTIYEGARIW